MQIQLNGLKLAAVSTVVPKFELKISDFYEQFGEKGIERIALSTGIRSVRIAEKGVNASTLCQRAAEYLFDRTGISREAIDAIVFISQTPDYKMPATSCVLQDRLKLKLSVVAFDINYGCSGYIYGLYQAALLIASKSAQKVLVCTGDVMSRYLHPNDLKVRLVLGDAGSATIVEAGEDVWAFNIYTDGSGYDKLIIPKNTNMKDGYLQMDGAAIMEFALREVSSSFNNVLEQKNWSCNDVQHAVLHQPNEFMLNYLRKKMRLTKEQLPIAVKNYGNTGPASIPLTLCDHYAGVENLGKAVFSGFGVGLSWGSIALNLQGTKMFKPIVLN